MKEQKIYRWTLLDKSDHSRVMVEAPDFRAAKAAIIEKRGGKNIPIGWKVVQGKAVETKLTAEDFKVGMSVARNSPGTQSVPAGMVGRVMSISDGGVQVQWPNHVTGGLDTYPFPVSHLTPIERVPVEMQPRQVGKSAKLIEELQRRIRAMEDRERAKDALLVAANLELKKLREDDADNVLVIRCFRGADGQVKATGRSFKAGVGEVAAALLMAQSFVADARDRHFGVKK